MVSEGWASELVDQERERRLRKIESLMIHVFDKEKDGKLTQACARLLRENSVLKLALKECSKRYLEATGRGGYGPETETAEYEFFNKIGENRIIEQMTRFSEKEEVQKATETPLNS